MFNMNQLKGLLEQSSGNGIIYARDRKSGRNIIILTVNGVASIESFNDLLTQASTTHKSYYTDDCKVILVCTEIDDSLVEVLEGYNKDILNKRDYYVCKVEGYHGANTRKDEVEISTLVKPF